MRSRLPFQDELAQLSALVLRSSWFVQLNNTVLPVKFRAKSVHHVDDYSMRCLSGSIPFHCLLNPLYHPHLLLS